MKKILNSAMILLFVSSLFIGCPPRVINPPITPNDTISDTITNPYDSIEYDSIEKYVSIEYLDNYLQNEVGDTFLFTSVKDGVVDTMSLHLAANRIEKSKQTDAKRKSLLISDDDYDYYYYTELIRKYMLYQSQNVRISLFINVVSHSDINNYHAGVNYSCTFRNLGNTYSSAKDCDCGAKDCISEMCFPSIITINRDDSLFVEIEHGKGITLFRDDEGNYWHLVE